MRLKGKVGIVSGAASGIGEATAKTFAQEGAAVVVADLNEEGGNRVVAEIRQAGAPRNSFAAISAVQAKSMRRSVSPRTSLASSTSCTTTLLCSSRDASAI